MFNADRHELLCLFAAMVMADKRVYAAEVKAFSSLTQDFFVITDNGPVPSAVRLSMWFDMNRENIRAKLTQDNFENWFETLMLRVTKIYSAKAVVGVMQKIAVSDNEVHISERALLVLVDKYWPKAA